MPAVGLDLGAINDFSRLQRGMYPARGMMSFSAYAKSRGERGLPGRSPNAVAHAVKTGRLARCLTADGRKIADPALADEEWSAATKADYRPLTGPTAPRPTPAMRALVDAVHDAGATMRIDGAPVANAEDLARGVAERAPAVNDLAVARARSERAKAELAELELLAKRGAVMLAADAEAKMADVFLRCRMRLLTIPARLREAAPHLAVDDVKLVERLIIEACEELAGGKTT